MRPHAAAAVQCEACVVDGLAIENGQQRAIVLHGTHLATVRDNVISGVRGASIYIEDGNEMYNRILYNVAVCPWALSGPKFGCTVPGTDNDQADTSLNQAGIWGLSSINHITPSGLACERIVPIRIPVLR